MKDNSTNSEDMNKQVVNEDGTAEVVNGKILLTEPKGNGKPAHIVPDEGVEIAYVEDKVEVELLDKTVPVEVKVKVSRDVTEAEVEVIPEYIIKYSILDQPAKTILKVKTKKEEQFTRAATREEIMTALENENVVYGIDDDIVFELSQSMKPMSKVVAKGDPMEEGQHGYLEYLVKTQIEMVEYDEDAAKVDYRERFNIPQVNEDDVLAIIHPPEEGIPGRRVDGREVPPPPVKEAKVTCREGATVNDEYTQVFATQKGRPVVKQHGRHDHTITVEKFYVHFGDVDMESGNLRFQGHLKIEGSVHEGMTVFADGDIIVTKNTAGAKTIAGGHVNIMGNCINSTVNAGGKQLLLQEIAEVLDYLKVSLEVAVESLEQITATLKSRGKVPVEKFPYIMQTLLKSKFPEIMDFVEQLQGILKEKSEFTPPPQVLERLNLLFAFFLEDGWMEAYEEKPLKDMYRYVDEASDAITIILHKETQSDINVLYVQNSNLNCTGDIIVSGSGAYNSSFDCSGKVTVNKLFRGGSINADNDIVIGELGSPGTSISHGVVQVSEGHSIKLGKVHEGSKIRIGDRMFRLDSTYSNIKIFLDVEEDKVKVNYWK